MRILTYCIFILILTTIFLSCSDEDIRLYHPEEVVPPEPDPDPEPEPQKFWLLEHVDYPDGTVGLVTRGDVTLSYSPDYLITTIDNLNSDFIKVNYKNDLVEYSRVRESGNIIYYDSLLIKINSDKRATSALHVTYRESQGVKVQTQNDSTYFGYNGEGYLIRMERFDQSGDLIPTYWEDYTFQGGNLTEIISSAGYKHVYTYNEQDYSLASSFAYEMPFNTLSINNWGGCWLLTNLRYLSAYLGNRSKNHVDRVLIYQNAAVGQASTEYADITYDYIYDEDKQVVEVEIEGFVNGNKIPENYITTFSYIEETIEEEP